MTRTGRTLAETDCCGNLCVCDEPRSAAAAGEPHPPAALAIMLGARVVWSLAFVWARLRG